LKYIIIFQLIENQLYMILFVLSAFYCFYKKRG